MSRASRDSGLDGVLLVDKPPGMTSHDVVGAVRRLTGQGRAGHSGTLDPAAAGVLAVCLGQATRAAEYLLAQDKEYRAEITFGAATDSHDATGRVTAEPGAQGLTAERLEAALAICRGTILQVPPMVSALKVEGRRLYQLARQGRTVEREPRPVTIHRLELLSFRPGTRATALVDVSCSKGTYVRSLARDLGEALGTGAFLSFLLRTRSGAFGLTDSLALEEVAEAAAAGHLTERLLTMDQALAHLPALEVTAAEAFGLAQGRQPHQLGLRYDGDGLVRLTLPGRGLVALASAGPSGLTTEKVLQTEPGPQDPARSRRGRS